MYHQRTKSTKTPISSTINSQSSHPSTAIDRSAASIASSKSDSPSGNASPSESAQSVTNRAKAKLQPIAEKLLASDVTRKFIALHNGLPVDVTAADLAAKIFGDEKPMLWLRRCIKQDKPLVPDERHELNETITRLVEVITPICIDPIDVETLEQHLNGSAKYASVSTSDPIVAKSQVALFKKVSMDLGAHNDWKLIHCDDLPKVRDKVTDIPHPPEIGIYGDGGNPSLDIVEVFNEGLVRFLNPHGPDPVHVRAALKDLADNDHVFVCVLFPERLSERNIERIEQAYPELILLVQGVSSKESEDNAMVLTQFKRIREEFCPT